MGNGFGVVAVVTNYLVIICCASKIVPHQMDQLYSPFSALIQRRQEDTHHSREEQFPRLYFDTIKAILVRTIKSYRAVKPEVNVATCFVRYAGLTPGERRAGKRLKSKTKEKDKEEITVKALVRDIVHTFILLLSDLTPEPISRVLRMATTMWTMTREMYKSVKQDEMGNCSLDYISRRFWWWLGI